MEGLASTAIYLASSLAAPQASGTIPHVASVMVMAAPAVDEVATGPAEVPVADPFAQARSRGGKSLDEAIVSEVRDRLDHPNTGWATGTGFAFDPEHGGGDDLGRDVTAAHDARIAFIRQRMEALRSEGASAAPMLRRLHVRLDLALAARRLAIAREALERPPVDCASIDPDACGSALAAVASPAAERPARHARPRRPPEPARRGMSVDMAVASSHPMPGAVVAQLADTGRHRSRRASGRPDRETARLVAPALRLAASRGAGRSPGSGQETARHATDRGAALTLGHARRSLATARDLLEADAGHDPHPRAKLAGLLHWEGSETWSLADYRGSAA